MSAWLEQQTHASTQRPILFVANRIAAGEVKVEYCPTGEDMLTDFFYTKPIQGSTFRKCRDQILNIKIYSDPLPTKAIEITEECVEESN
jgi:hypothetical protein